MIGTFKTQNKWQLLLLLFKSRLNPVFKTSFQILTGSGFCHSIFVSITPQLEPGTSQGTGKSCWSRLQQRALTPRTHGLGEVQGLRLLLHPASFLGGHPWAQTPGSQTAPDKQGQGAHLCPGRGWGVICSAEVGCRLRPILPTAQTSPHIPSRTELGAP